MYKTAECVSPKHPDKVADRISDAILDAALSQDPESRVAIETMGGHGIVTVTGEMTTRAYVDIRSIVERIAGKNVGIQINVVKQSPEISQGVDSGGAGDQGIMVGYACHENTVKIPQELYLARLLCQYLYEIDPQDGKTQVTMSGNNIHSIVASWSNTKTELLIDRIQDWLKVISHELGITHQDPKIFANPAGDWVCCGFDADTGLTGRKLAVDNYGPAIPIGGGAFSGKDPSKVDRSAAYMARYIALKALNKLYTKTDEAEVLVKIAYAIGVAEPVMITIQGRKFGEEMWTNIDPEHIIELNQLTPKAIIETLELKKPIYESLAEWGSFGRPNVKWEMINLD